MSGLLGLLNILHELTERSSNNDNKDNDHKNMSTTSSSSGSSLAVVQRPLSVISTAFDVVVENFIARGSATTWSDITTIPSIVLGDGKWDVKLRMGLATTNDCRITVTSAEIPSSTKLSRFLIEAEILKTDGTPLNGIHNVSTPRLMKVREEKSFDICDAINNVSMHFVRPDKLQELGCIAPNGSVTIRFTFSAWTTDAAAAPTDEKAVAPVNSISLQAAVRRLLDQSILPDLTIRVRPSADVVVVSTSNKRKRVRTQAPAGPATPTVVAMSDADAVAEDSTTTSAVAGTSADFKVHRALLAVVSPVLFDVFSTDKEEVPNGIWTVTDTNAATVKQWVHYVYNDAFLPNEHQRQPTTETFQELEKVLQQANKYQIYGLGVHVLNYIASSNLIQPFTCMPAMQLLASNERIPLYKAGCVAIAQKISACMKSYNPVFERE